MLLVKAGQPVNDFVEKLSLPLEPGDIIIDGGDSKYEDTMRSTAYVESQGLLHVGNATTSHGTIHGTTHSRVGKALKGVMAT